MSQDFSTETFNGNSDLYQHFTLDPESANYAPAASHGEYSEHSSSSSSFASAAPFAPIGFSDENWESDLDARLHARLSEPFNLASSNGQAVQDTMNGYYEMNNGYLDYGQVGTFPSMIRSQSMGFQQPDLFAGWDNAPLFDNANMFGLHTFDVDETFRFESTGSNDYAPIADNDVWNGLDVLSSTSSAPPTTTAASNELYGSSVENTISNIVAESEQPLEENPEEDLDENLEEASEGKRTKRVQIKNHSVLDTKLKTALTKILAQEKNANEASRLGMNITLTNTVRGVSVTGVYWYSPAQDDSIPVTQRQTDQCIDALVQAILNNQDVRENTTTKQFRNRWADGATYYKPREIRAVAHELLDIMISVHCNGWTKHIYDKDQRALIQKTMNFSFQERFDAVVELLKCSKTSCQQAMKGERHYALVGNPVELFNRTASNKTSNKTKAGRLADMKELTRSGLLDNVVEDVAGDVVESVDKSVDKTEEPSAEGMGQRKKRGPYRKAPANTTAKGKASGKGRKRALDEDDNEDVQTSAAPGPLAEKCTNPRAKRQKLDTPESPKSPEAPADDMGISLSDALGPGFCNDLGFIYAIDPGMSLDMANGQKRTRDEYEDELGQQPTAPGPRPVKKARRKRTD